MMEQQNDAVSGSFIGRQRVTNLYGPCGNPVIQPSWILQQNCYNHGEYFRSYDQLSTMRNRSSQTLAMFEQYLNTVSGVSLIGSTRVTNLYGHCRNIVYHLWWLLQYYYH